MRCFTDDRKWFHSHRFGFFIHWGIYAADGRHEQTQQRYKVPAEEYEKLVQGFTAENFSPDSWLDLAEECGMDYMVLTVKHHDGFCLWDTKETSYNVMNSPCGKDIVKLLSDACHKRDFPLELYYSCVDWHHKAYPNIGRHHEIVTDPANHNMEAYMDFLKKQIREICSNYGRIHGIWWDMNVPKHEDLSVNELIRSLQSCAVINNRGYGPGDYSTPERDFQSEGYIPFAHPTEACDSVGSSSWGYRKDEDYFSIRKLERQIALYLGLGGNFLLNAGPKADGTFPEESVAIFKAIGKWYKKCKSALLAPPCPGVVDIPELICTGGGRELNLILLSNPPASSLRLAPLAALPCKVEYLNDPSKNIEATLEPTPYTLGLPQALRLRNLPVNEMNDEIAVIRLTFEDEVIFPDLSLLKDDNSTIVAHG